MRKKETFEETQKRLAKLCPDCDGPIWMDAQTALNELCNYFLGEDWYCVDFIHPSQVNVVIVYEIERNYKGKNIKPK